MTSTTMPDINNRNRNDLPYATERNEEISAIIIEQ